jgi:hypothetical protein
MEVFQYMTHMVKQRLHAAVVLTLAAGVGGGCGGPPELGPKDGRDLPREDLARVQVGDEAPDFTLAAYSGDYITLSQYRGMNNVVLVFYRGHW